MLLTEATPKVTVITKYHYQKATTAILTKYPFQNATIMYELKCHPKVSPETYRSLRNTLNVCLQYGCTTFLQSMATQWFTQLLVSET